MSIQLVYRSQMSNTRIHYKLELYKLRAAIYQAELYSPEILDNVMIRIYLNSKF